MIKEAKSSKTVVVDMSAAAVKYNQRTGAAQYEVDPSYVMPPDGAVFCDVIDRARQKKSQNVMIVGPTGCGKTEFAKQFAARKGLSLLKMDCSNITEAEKWFGRLDIQAGSISWEETPFDRVVSEGNHVILLDEINRAAPEVLNVLLPLRHITFVLDSRSSSEPYSSRWRWYSLVCDHESGCSLHRHHQARPCASCSLRRCCRVDIFA